MEACVFVYLIVCFRVYIYNHLSRRTHTRTHARTHARTHTHTHTPLSLFLTHDLLFSSLVMSILLMLACDYLIRRFHDCERDCFASFITSNTCTHLPFHLVLLFSFSFFFSRGRGRVDLWNGLYSVGGKAPNGTHFSPVLGLPELAHTSRAGCVMIFLVMLGVFRRALKRLELSSR